MAKKKLKGMEIFLGIALAIILIGLFNFGISTYYPQPQYSDSCNSFYSKPYPVTPTQAEMDAQQKCQEDYNLAYSKYQTKTFYFFIVGGLILTILGLAFIKNFLFQIVSTGSGIALVGEGIYKNIQNQQTVFLAGVVVFLIISFFAYRRFQK